MRRKNSFVKKQKLQDRQSGKTYWDWTFMHNRMNDDGEVAESRQSNPDILSEEAGKIFQRGPKMTKAMQILDDAVEELEPILSDVWKLYNREGLTEEEIAKKLDVSRSSISRYLSRAYDSIVDYCEAHSVDLTKLDEAGQ